MPVSQIHIVTLFLPINSARRRQLQETFLINMIIAAQFRQCVFS